jgi:hypothetical protein
MGVTLSPNAQALGSAKSDVVSYVVLLAFLACAIVGGFILYKIILRAKN